MNKKNSRLALLSTLLIYLQVNEIASFPFYINKISKSTYGLLRQQQRRDPHRTIILELNTTNQHFTFSLLLRNFSKREVPKASPNYSTSITLVLFHLLHLHLQSFHLSLLKTPPFPSSSTVFTSPSEYVRVSRFRILVFVSLDQGLPDILSRGQPVLPLSTLADWSAYRVQRLMISFVEGSFERFVSLATLTFHLLVNFV